MWIEFPYQATFNGPLHLNWTPSLPLDMFNIAWTDLSP